MGWTRCIAGMGLISVVASHGCLRADGFECADDESCVRNGEDGRCENAGVCSYPDDSCDSGRRYSPNAGSLADECLEPDVSTSSSSSSSSSESEGSEASAGDACVTVDVDGRAFAACPGALTFLDAEFACTERGMTLASFHTVAENLGIAELLPFPDSYWIGLNDRDVETVWVWVDRTPTDLFAWAEGEPDDVDTLEDCVVTRNGGTWSVQRCEIVNGYVCASPTAQ